MMWFHYGSRFESFIHLTKI
uniref:Uncharacterized protein n=1 Tax=Anguilla anguilla TaxID=7936 RepID=A0A0E9VEA3_ANGAN